MREYEKEQKQDIINGMFFLGSKNLFKILLLESGEHYNDE